MHATFSNNLTVRPAVSADLPAIVELRNRCFSSSHWRTNEERVEYMRQVFFNNPWRHAEVGPVVALSGDEVVGFVGVVPRKMRLMDRSLVAALLSQFMVAPEARRRGVGRALLERAFDGPQDFSFSDIPEPATERIWVGAGGVSVPMYKFFWTATLRPFANAAAGLGVRPAARIVRRAAAPGLRLLDYMVVRRERLLTQNYRMQPVAPAASISEIGSLIPADVLHAAYSEDEGQWLLAQLTEKWGTENVHTLRINTSAGATAGILVYVLSERIAHVHMILGRSGEEDAVLDCVLDHFREAGYIGARGRFQPVMLAAFKKRQLPFTLIGHGLLVHSRDSQIMTHVLAGRALFTGLTGEWVLHF